MTSESLLVEGVAERIASNGCAQVRAGGENYFVYGAARGETVLCRKLPQLKHRAELVEVLVPSPRRVAPGCPHYGVCGGCSLRHIDYETQLAEKEDILRGAFLHIAGMTALPPLTIHRSPPDGYRNRAQLHRVKPRAREGGRKTALPSAPLPAAGFIARDGVTVVPVTGCPILGGTLQAALREGRLTAPLDKDRWTVFGRGGQLLSEGGAARGRFRFNAGEAASAELFVDAGVFFQSNAVMLERLLGWLLGVAEGEAGPAGDFYAGVGVFAAFLRHTFEKIDLLEENRAALALARENLGAERERAFRFFGLSDTAWVKQHGRRAAPYGFLCVDPSRRGLSGPMLRWICEHPPRTLVYMSCECSALARDTRALAAAGFQLESLDMFDFYPQTPRLETAVLFRYNQTSL